MGRVSAVCGVCTVPALLLALLIGSVPAKSAGAGGPAPVEWRWGKAYGPCDSGKPVAVLLPYMEKDRDPADEHSLTRCLEPSAEETSAEDKTKLYVLSSLRFVKRFKLIPPFKVSVDHTRLEEHHGGELARASSFVKGSAACTRLWWGECRIELERQPDGTAVLRRIDEEGLHEEDAPEGTLVDDMWLKELVAAPAVANLYTGRLWRMTPDPEGVDDTVDGRPATRHHIRSHTRGVFFFTSRFERVMWFSKATATEESRILKVCDYQQDYGFTHVSEFVREDLKIEPTGDCHKWF